MRLEDSIELLMDGWAIELDSIPDIATVRGPDIMLTTRLQHRVSPDGGLHVFVLEEWDYEEDTQAARPCGKETNNASS